MQLSKSVSHEYHKNRSSHNQDSPVPHTYDNFDMSPSKLFSPKFNTSFNFRESRKAKYTS